MDILIVIAALAVVVSICISALIRSRGADSVIRKERDEIYRSCFLRGLAGILASMAKADGTVTLEEVNVAARLFNDMGLDPKDRDMCYDSFSVSKDGKLPMSYYASLFAPYSTRDSRVIIYEILWDITAADGKLDPGEAKMLKDLLSWLSLGPEEYDRNEKRCASRFMPLSEAAKSAGAKIDRILHP